jgi:hypothetical protein
MQKIRNMRLSEARLTRQKRNAQGTAFDPAQQLEPYSVLQLRKVHVENSLGEKRTASRAFLAENLDRIEIRHSRQAAFQLREKGTIFAATH